MRLRTLAAIAATAQGALAFRDTSPFFLFSTSSLPSESFHLHPSDTLATARTVHDHLTTTLHSCPSHPYILVKQPSVSASDFEGETTAPHLRRRMNGHDSSIKITQIIRSVIGDLSATSLADDIHSQCPHMSLVTLKDGQLPSSVDKKQLITVEMAAPSGTEAERSNALDRNDLYLEQILSKIGGEYTVVYATTPAVQKKANGEENFKLVNQQNGQQVYEMDEPFPSSVKANHFKRDMSAYPRAENGSSAINADLPLFEKYTFLSSGIFMGVSVSFLLLSILYVGLSAVSGLEVSYMAFSKEMGPAAQKKQ